MTWVYTAVLAACSAGILGGGVALTRRLFRDEMLAAGEHADRAPYEPPGPAPDGSATARPGEVTEVPR